MVYTTEQECGCGRLVVATVRVTGGGAPYGIGEFGPPGAVFEDAAEVEILATVAIDEDGVEVVTQDGHCACGSDYGRPLADDAAEAYQREQELER